MADVTMKSNVPQVLSELKDRKARALEIIGGKAESYAKQNIKANDSIRTSNLLNSISHAQMDENTEVIGTNVKYAKYVEFGHWQEPGRYVPAIGKRLVRDYVPAKPFLRPAAEGHRQEYKEVFERVLKKG